MTDEQISKELIMGDEVSLITKRSVVRANYVGLSNINGQEKRYHVYLPTRQMILFVEARDILKKEKGVEMCSKGCKHSRVKPKDVTTNVVPHGVLSTKNAQQTGVTKAGVMMPISSPLASKVEATNVVTTNPVATNVVATDNKSGDFSLSEKIILGLLAAMGLSLGTIYGIQSSSVTQTVIRSLTP